MRFNPRKASQMVEYLLLFAVVVTVVLGAADVISHKTSGILGNTLDDMGQTIYSFSWVASDCDPCPVDCGGGTTTCSYVCKRSDDTIVSDTQCVSLGSRPPDAQLDCNTQPCPIKCVWSTTWNNGDCSPACGYNRTRTDTREIETPAQYGGVPCDPVDGVRTMACDDSPCTSKCGDGLISSGEECDDTNFGNYGSGSCANANVMSLAGGDKTFLSGNISCYPKGDPNECHLDMSQCEYETCGDWTAQTAPYDCGVNASCTAGHDGCTDGGTCETGYLLNTRTCERYKYSDQVNPLSHAQVQSSEDKCVADSRCSYACAAGPTYAINCSPTLPAASPNQAWTISLQEECPSNPGPCTAICKPSWGTHISAGTNDCECTGAHYSICDSAVATCVDTCSGNACP